MEFSAETVAVEEITRCRDLYRQEMKCQIIHDSLHSRKGWTQSFLLTADGARAGYGAIAIDGPWKGKPTVFEFYVLPCHRSHAFDLFSVLLNTSGAKTIEIQSNDPLITVMLHTFAHGVTSESILFHDQLTTALKADGAVVRPTRPEDAAQITDPGLDTNAGWVVEVEGQIAGTGGILFHYNRPYGDIYMAVAEGFRRRGLGSFLVQELKRTCYEQGSVPAARCNPKNIASRRTLQKTGFVPCGHILTGSF
jgi:GNAT superfamily N-acetyltransferase